MNFVVVDAVVVSRDCWAVSSADLTEAFVFAAQALDHFQSSFL